MAAKPPRRLSPSLASSSAHSTRIAGNTAADEFVRQQIVEVIAPYCASLVSWTYDLFRELPGWWKITTCHGCGKIWLTRGGVESPVELPKHHPLIRALEAIPP